MSQESQDSESVSISGASYSGGEAGSQKKSPTAKAIQAWLVSRLSQVLQVEPRDIDIHAPFTNYGLTSVDAVGLSGDLEEWLGLQLSPTLAYEYPTIETLARHLAGRLEQNRSLSSAWAVAFPEPKILELFGSSCVMA
jgi:acyl carrier protein